MNEGRSIIDRDRLFENIMALATITDPDRPYTRRSFSERFMRGREWLRDQFESAGMEVRLDAGANLIARLAGSDPEAAAIMLGSHSDTVPSGGRFDGIAGILAALEAVRGLQTTGYKSRHPIEIVDFLAEEPSEYGLSCVGSRAMSGALEPAMLAYVDAKGETLSDAIARIGGDPARIATARRADIAGFFELHIEQGIVLENSKIELGLVTSIVGIARVEIVLEGSADHAGTTPMHLRRDASIAAAELLLVVAQRAQSFAARGDNHFVATVGHLEISPNAINVVPGGARMIVDVRSEKPGPMDEFIGLLDVESVAIASRNKAARVGFAVLSKTTSSLCDERLRGLLARGAATLGRSAMLMASGASHDAAFISRIAPSAMLFIPCRGGKSHSPKEWAEPEDLAKGAATLFEAIRLLDGTMSASGAVS
jgi:beta-ureidopropionase / N-carbamoyl-L-amino-acid hydrolase